MSENRGALAEMADGLFANLRGEAFDHVWPKLEAAGFGLLLIPEGEGGFGGDWGDLAAVMRLAGFHALSAPLGEHIVTRSLLHAAGVDVPGGVLGLAPGPDAAVPWGRHADAVVVRSKDGLFLAPATYEESTSPAGELRDFASYRWADATRLKGDAEPFELIAFLRSCQAAGALDAALELAITHCSERQQFGRPLSKFQAVQQSIALLAMEAAAANCAAQGAASALDRGDDAGASLPCARAPCCRSRPVGPV